MGLCPTTGKKSVWYVLKVSGFGFVLFILVCTWRGTVKSLFYLLVCQVQEDTLLVLWQSVGDGVSFHTTLQRRFLSLLAKITTMKSVPAEDCAGRKAREKGDLLKSRKERRKYSRVLSDVYSPFNSPLTGGKDGLFCYFILLPQLESNLQRHGSHLDIFILCLWNWKLKIYSTLGAEVTCPWLLLFKQPPPMRLPFTNWGPQGLQLGTARPSAGLLQLPKIVPHYTPQGLAGITAASRKLHQVKGLWPHCDWRLPWDLRLLRSPLLTPR